MAELTFPLEKTRAMRIFGLLITLVLPGRVLAAAMVMIGLFFMSSVNFSTLSVYSFFIFFIPMSLFFYFRMVRKGNKLMEGWCDITFENNTMTYKTGYPNTLISHWQKLEIDDETRDIFIKGSEELGYQLQLSGLTEPEVRLGLWINKEDAESAAKELQQHLKGKIEEYKRPETISKS